MQINPVSYTNVDITGGFWARKQALNRDVTVESVRSQFEKTGRFAAFRCDWKPGMPHQPHFFWDSDVAKWIESAAYVLQKHPDDKLQGYIEDVIDCIERNQDADGYFNIYYTVVDPSHRFTYRANHELYCAGHLIEAAVAYYEATGRARFLHMMCRYADLIDRVFRVEKSAGFLTPGHEEIELALIRLYQCTGEKKYLDLSLYFLDARGTNPRRDNLTIFDPLYFQDIPVRDQRIAAGHAVRACYLYCAMADAARITGDAALQKACESVFESITQKRMYITGGVGASADGERFGGDYDLPNASAYAETCAAISLALFASRMSLADPDARYADAAERAMYNGVLSGLSLDGKAFFYENPLAVDLAQRRGREGFARFPRSQRAEVFDCSCCPPNMTRFLAGIGGMAYAVSKDTVYVHQYMHSTARVCGGTLAQQTDYPDTGTVRFEAQGLAGKRIALRIPGWCRKYDLDGVDARGQAEKGYVYIRVPSDTFVFTLLLDMQPVFYEASPRVLDDMGKVALVKGPVVYCMEGIDNANDLAGLCADIFDPVCESAEVFPGVPTLTASGWRKFECTCCGGPLYRPASGDYRPAKLRFIPYYAFANRGETDMAVWVPKF